MAASPEGTVLDGYVRQVVTGPDRRDVVLKLVGWLAEQICRDLDPGDYGALYGLWADLEDVADAYTDEDTFALAAELAARQWLDLPRGDGAARRAWLLHWRTWLMEYGLTHHPHWLRPAGPHLAGSPGVPSWVTLAREGLLFEFHLGDSEVPDDCENVDVVIESESGVRWGATVLTLREVAVLLDRWKATGEYGGGTHLRIPDLLVVDSPGLETMVAALVDLMASGQTRGLTALPPGPSLR